MAEAKKNLNVSPIDMKSKVVQELLAEQKANETDRKTLTYEEALEMVNDNWDKVTSKNAMLKLIRANGFSISMGRLFKIYKDFEIAYAAQKPKETK